MKESAPATDKWERGRQWCLFLQKPPSLHQRVSWGSLSEEGLDDDYDGDDGYYGDGGAGDYDGDGGDGDHDDG